MTDATDVLVKWGDIIRDADRPYADFVYHRCIRNLAAEIRALRENEVCADTECRDLHIRDLSAEIAELREKLAAQEPDATLGRLVREGRESL